MGAWFDRSLVDQALSEIQQLYADAGHVEVTVHEGSLEVRGGTAVGFFPVPFRTRKHSNVYLNCVVSEGPRYCFGNVDLPNELDSTEVAPPIPGTTFSENCLLEFEKRIRSYYQDTGRLLKTLEILQEVQKKTRCVDVRVVAQAYPDLLVGQIEFRGNFTHPDSFYRREIELEEESVFDPVRLETSVRHLSETGVLTSLSGENVHLRIDETSRRVDIIFGLTEKERQGIWYSFEPGRSGGPEIRALYSILNLLGFGEALGFDVSTGDTTTNIALRFTSRYLMGTDLPISFAIGFFSRRSGLRLPGLDQQLLKLISKEEKGISGGLEYRITEKRQIGIRFVHSQQKAGSRRLTFEPYFWNGRQQMTQYHFSQRLSIFGGDSSSVASRQTFALVRNGWNDRFSALKLRFSSSHAFFSGRGVPLAERLFLRSDHIRSLSLAGPLGKKDGEMTSVGGDLLVAITGEYQYPVNSRISVVPFVDLGWSGSMRELADYQIVDETNWLTRCSTGSELRFEIPRLPPLRLALAWNPLRSGSIQDHPRFLEDALTLRFGLGR